MLSIEELIMIACNSTEIEDLSSGKYDKRKSSNILIYSLYIVQTYIAIFSEIQKISKCLGFVIASFVNRSSLIYFGWPVMALFDSISLLFFGFIFCHFGLFFVL